nr:hypothetical protein [Tanacetum cinerariifolium]
MNYTTAVAQATLASYQVQIFGDHHLENGSKSCKESKFLLKILGGCFEGDRERHSGLKKQKHVPLEDLAAEFNLRPQIVSLGMPSVSPNECVGKYVSPNEWNTLITDPDRTALTANAMSAYMDDMISEVTYEIKKGDKHARVMVGDTSLTRFTFPKQTRKPRSDRGIHKARHFVSSASTHHYGSSSHQEDDDDNEGTSRASTPSPITYLNSLLPLNYKKIRHSHFFSTR